MENPTEPHPSTNSGHEDRPARPGGRRQGPGRKGPASDRAAPPLQVVELAPMAVPAMLRPRHWGILASFLAVVLLPTLLAGWYLWARAEDQYASSLGFTVREENGGSASDLLGGFAAQLSLGGSVQSDMDILYEFVQSPEMVARIDAALDLRAQYSAPHDRDPYFALAPDATLEDLTAYWDRIVRISYDETTRLLKLEVLAYDPRTAQAIGQRIIAESEALINTLNAVARADTLRYAERDLAAAEARLKASREALIRFRTRTQTVDPLTDLQGRMGVVNTLQQQLAEALVALDMLGTSTSETDPRVKQARLRIEVIRNRIEQERQAVASGDRSGPGEDYPTILAEYEGLIADRQFAEETYRAALAALDVARSNAARQSSYLAVFLRPTLPQTAEYPRRAMLFGLVALFLLLFWAIGALVYYSVRDSR